MFAGLKAKLTHKDDKSDDKKNKKQDQTYAEMVEEEEQQAPVTSVHIENKQNKGLDEDKSVKMKDGVAVNESDGGEKQKKLTAMQQIKKGMTKAYTQLGTKVDDAKTNVNKAFQGMDAGVKDAIVSKKKHLNEWIAVQADQKVMVMMDQMQPKIAKSVQDNFMPRCIQNFVAEMTQKLWLDLTDLIRFELRVKMQEQSIQLSRQPDKYKILCLWYKFRNWYLYAVHPHDKTFWQQIRDPSFIFLKLFQSITHYGIQYFAFILLFIAIDKSEEYQLIAFILGFKTMQFLTAGCITAILGYFSYFVCATILPIEQVKQDLFHQSSRILVETSENPYEVLNLNFCFHSGPGSIFCIYQGSGMNLTVGIVAFFGQIFLIWIAFICLLYSKSRVDFIDSELNVKKGIRGGRLIKFMIYDLIVFFGTVITTMLIYYEIYYIPGRTFKLYQQVDGLFYFAKLVYGLLSFPFLLFAVDFFVQVFTNAKPTAYDQFGNVVPLTNKIKLVYSELPTDEQDAIDIEEAMAHDKSIVI